MLYTWNFGQEWILTVLTKKKKSELMNMLLNISQCKHISKHRVVYLKHITIFIGQLCLNKAASSNIFLNPSYQLLSQWVMLKKKCSQNFTLLGGCPLPGIMLRAPAHSSDLGPRATFSGQLSLIRPCGPWRALMVCVSPSHSSLGTHASTCSDCLANPYCPHWTVSFVSIRAGISFVRDVTTNA